MASTSRLLGKIGLVLVLSGVFIPPLQLSHLGVQRLEARIDVGNRPGAPAHNILKEFRNQAADPKNKPIMISDKTANAIYTFLFPEAWESFAPVRSRTVRMVAPGSPAAAASEENAP